MDKNKFDFATRIGFTMIPPTLNATGLSFGFPVELNYIFGKQKHFVELGHGFTPYFSIGGNFRGFLFGRAGYRFVAPSGLLIRAAILPYFSYYWDADVVEYVVGPFFGLSFGKMF